MTPKTLKNQIKKLPQAAGVYFFRIKGKPLYIGKTSNLRSRAKYYLNTQDIRLRKMIELADKLDYQKTDSEIEALILESQLIKKYKPKFNIMLRDDKQYFYVGFTDEEFPKIYLTHQPEKISSIKYKVLSGEKTLNTKYKILNTDFLGPFTDGTALKTTLKYLRKLFPYCTCKQKHNNFCLNYHIENCLGFCCLKTPATNKQLKKYEENIKAIKNILTGKKNTLIKKLGKEMVNYGKKHDFEKAIELKNKIEKLERIFENIKIINRMNNGTKTEGKAPERIEGYDISNIQGKYATGSMVVFENGWPNKNEYRKFKIKTRNTTDDTGMLKEVLTRRFNHPEWPRPDLIIIDGGKGQLNTALAVLKIAGLKTQVIALTKDKKHTGHHIFTSNQKKPILLAKLPNQTKNLILRVDAEAHRFAISYYRKLHRKSTI